MKRLGRITDALASRTLTAWLAGAFILYYLTAAVWSTEAFASFIVLLRHNLVFQAAHLLLTVNVVLRSLHALDALRTDRTAFLLRLPLLVGLSLFLLTFFLSITMRQDVRLIVGEGDVVTLPWDRESYRVLAVEPALEKKMRRTGEGRVFDYEPGLIVADQRGRQIRIGAFPPRALGPSYVHVLNFGIGPGVALSRDGSTVVSGYMALMLLPFGAVDRFELPPWPYLFYLSIVPNRTVTKGNETGYDYDLTRPKYRVEVVKGDNTIARGETDSAITFDGNMTLSFLPPSDWVLLEAVYDPVLPVFAASLALLAGGSVLYGLSVLRRAYAAVRWA